MIHIKKFSEKINKPLKDIMVQAEKLGFAISKDSMLTIEQIKELCIALKIHIDSVGADFVDSSMDSNDEAKNQASDKIENSKILPQKDRIFLQDSKVMPKFEFNALVASVFDDMLERSVPFYDEVMNLAIFFIQQHLQSCNKIPTIYDLGSSTGNLLIKLATTLQKRDIKAHLYGVDNAEAMIKLAQLKSEAMGFDIKFLQADFLTLDFSVADVFLTFYTMQFVRPLQRQNMIKKIYNALCDGGIFLFAEKVISQDSRLEGQMIACYYDYKAKQGYTHTEIYKKREALENVLIPYSIEENHEMLCAAGFTHIEILFKWVNFTLFLARK